MFSQMFFEYAVNEQDNQGTATFTSPGGGTIQVLWYPHAVYPQHTTTTPNRLVAIIVNGKTYLMSRYGNGRFPRDFLKNLLIAGGG